MERSEKEETAERAVAYKHSGYNCTQAVVLALAERYGLPAEEMVRMTAGFAVGMGTMETTCGALIGANLILGLKPEENRSAVARARELYNRFLEMCGATLCKELKGRDTGVPVCPCDDCVRNAVIAVSELLQQQES